MHSGTTTERLIAGILYLVSFTALLPYFVGFTLVPFGSVWVGGLALTVGVTLLAWRRSGFTARHAAQAALLILAAYVTELLALLCFIVVVVFQIPFSLRESTLLSGPLAGYNPETLMRLALAPVFLITPFVCSYKAIRGREYVVPCIGSVVGYVASRSQRGRPQ